MTPKTLKGLPVGCRAGSARGVALGLGLALAFTPAFGAGVREAAPSDILARTPGKTACWPTLLQRTSLTQMRQKRTPNTAR